MKKVVILHHNKGQLANQLWNFVSIYAYCLEKGYRCENWSFFEYRKYFNISVRNRLIDFLFFKSYCLYSPFFPFRVARKIGYILYDFFVALIRFFYKEKIVYSGNSFNEVNDFYYLPPTKESTGKLADLENDKKIETIYFDGWLFRNPKGLLKYRKQIIEYFQPKKNYRRKVDTFVNNLRKKFKHLVGVHIRQRARGDSKEVVLENRKMYISNQELEIVEKAIWIYLKEVRRKASQTCFVVCSNKKVDISNFSKLLNIVFAGGNLIEDLYLLTKMDAILGCRSTFGTFAAFYGNIPHFTFTPNGRIKKTKLE